MRVLDIDLDFFLADCCPLADVGERPALLGHEPWPLDSVAEYLEKNLGLSRAHRIPGRAFVTHDGALTFWHELVETGRLAAPFRVTHVDAHSDLGIGRPGPRFVLENVLSRKPDKRIDIDTYYKNVQLDEANYLLFALAFRYIDELDNVRMVRSRPDIPREIAITDADGGYTGIQLVSAVSRLMEKFNGAEPVIPFHVYLDPHDFHAPGEYDFMSIAQSPRYAPREADGIMEVVKGYMEII